MAHDIPKLQVSVRTRLGSRETSRLRQVGQLPAVIYGHQQAPVHIATDAKEIANLLHRNTHVLEVAYDSKTEPCLVKDVQWDHLGATILHLDLTRVDLTEKVRTNVALELAGEPSALKQAGAMLEHPLAEIEVECQALNIPDSIRMDISELDLDKSLTVADLSLPEGVVCTLAPETTLASITIVAVQEEEDETEVEAAEAQPEVIGEKKPEEEEGGSKQ